MKESEVYQAALDRLHVEIAKVPFNPDNVHALIETIKTLSLGPSRRSIHG